MNLVVMNKESGKLYDVFDIVYNRAGYPHFLIYKDGQWVRVSAKHYKPYTMCDMIEELNEMDESYEW